MKDRPVKTRKRRNEGNRLPGKRASSPDAAVGQRIRHLRRQRAISLETVGAQTGLSIGFLSQVERGLSSPSLRVLASIADVFSVSLGALFGPAGAAGEGDAVVVRRGRRPKLSLWRSGISKQLLTPAAGAGSLNVYLVRLAPGGSTGEEVYAHQGEEAGLVLEGAMSLTVDTKTYKLKAGDSFRFSSTTPHRFRNPLERETVVVWVNALG
ncbi:transcriptional regulator, XRE family with cupin sensor [Enhydrobacter aerosaccus]|uniref:Transcriptional regulator, XRE family with cupin sensor n=1 Tax=Enhydrobacter aerosaccus TaxID=225324 RepID=A0A1T4MY27_9HYPH|nr:transcriptional regulator, XRE family with cupin sensor [Enhydrobacter aerosaccus]